MKKGTSKQIVWLAKVKKHYSMMRKKERLKMLFVWLVLGIVLSTQTIADTNIVTVADALSDKDRAACIAACDKAIASMQEMKKEFSNDKKSKEN